MAKRGLANADQATKTRVARMGGQASRGGGRRPSGIKGGQSSSQKTSR